MELYGLDVTKQPYLARKKLLFELLEGAPPEIAYTSYTFELEKAWEDVIQRGAEGLILKNVNSGYQYERSYHWLKVKNWKYEICNVIGYTKGENARSPFFGSLVLTNQNGKFRGCVGSGFNDWELRTIKDLFTDAPEITKPFDIDESYVAVKTDLQVKVKFYKATVNEVLRFPVFAGIAQTDNPTYAHTDIRTCL